MKRTAVIIAAVLAGSLPAQATATNLGGHCPPLSATDVAVDRPVIGKPWSVSWAFPEPWNAQAWMALGVTDPNLPIFKGCTLHVDPLVMLPTAVGGVFSWDIPRCPSLIGARVYLQFLWTAETWQGIPWSPALSDGWALTLGLR